MGFFSKIAFLLDGGSILLSFSDTVPGFFCSPYSCKALDQLRKLKKRSPSKGFIVLKADISDLSTPTPLERKFADRFWPGPLTLVLTVNESRLLNISPDGATIAVRYPSDIFWTPFLSFYTLPVVSTSANEYSELYFNCLRSIENGLQNYKAISEYTHQGNSYAIIKTDEFNGHILVNLSREPDPEANCSTIISLKMDRLKILREGSIRRADLESFYSGISREPGMP